MIRYIRKLWSSETNGLTAAALIIGAASIVSRLVGVLRDRALASSFGAGDILDAYYAAFRVPDFLYNLIILGALSAGFIPVFSEYLETREKKQAWHLAEQVFFAVGVSLVMACALLALLAPVIVPLTVPGFSAEKIEATVRLSRIMFLSPFFLGLSAVMGGILQTTRRFFAFAAAPVIYNLSIIFGIYFFVPRLGLEGLAWGVVLGAFLHFAVQASVAFKMGLRRIPRPSFRHEGVRRILCLMAPRMAALAVSQINLVILLIFASALPVGSVAVFNLANNLQSFPVGIIGISFAVAAFPLLSKAAGYKDKSEFIQALSSAIRKTTFFILPATALFFLCRAQIVRLALGAGVFDWNDTIQTADVLSVFLISLYGQSLVPLLSRAFYSLQNTWVPFLAGLISEMANIVLAYFLKDVMGIMGLALAFSVATYLNLIFLWFMLRRKQGPLGFRKIAISLAKVTAASSVLLGAGYPVRQLIGTWFPLETFWQVALQAGLATLFGLAAFFVTAWILKMSELKEFMAAVNKRIFKSAGPVAGAEEAQGV